MTIPDEDVAQVRAATDFVAVASEHIGLKRVGRRWVGLCPFHAEKSASFSLNAEEGLYYCFGCGARGDVITFVREVEHLDFVEAVELLAAKAGIVVRNDGHAGERLRHQPLYEAMEKAVEWYHQRLRTAPDAAAARAYLRRERGYDADVVSRYRLGWAPNDWDSLSRALRLPDQVLTDTGLGFVTRGRQRDAFRGRILFPIFDASGRAVALGGRILPGGDGPKYKNSADTPIYSKRRILYGLNWAKKSVVDAGEVVVCEGYTDVIAMHSAGIGQAVATCGTSLAEEHFRALKNFSRRVVLAYDADAAGQAAADRFAEWESRFEMDIAVAGLPAGADPADVARNDPDALRRAVAESLPYLGFRVQRVLAAADMRSPEGRARAAQAALAVVGAHPNPLVRDQYLMTIADRCRIDAEALRRLPPVSGSAPEPQARRSRRPEERAAAPAAEVAALRLAVNRPEDVADRLDDVLFSDPLHKAAFSALAGADTLHEALEGAEPEAAELLARLAVEESDDDPDDVIAHLVRLAALRALADMESQARAGGPDLSALAADTAWLKLHTEALSDADRRVEAAGLLVAWMADRGDATI